MAKRSLIPVAFALTLALPGCIEKSEDEHEHVGHSAGKTILTVDLAKVVGLNEKAWGQETRIDERPCRLDRKSVV